MTPVLDPNPFPGPRPYRHEEEKRFRGRKPIARRLQGMMLVQRCVTLYGPSGSGKSSLMQASILPEVERDERSYRTLFVDQWPESPAPLEWLATRLHEQLALGPDRNPDPRRALAEMIEHADRPLFLYIDQLEQTLTRHSTEEVKDLVECLDDLVEHPRQELHLVLGIREEDLGRWRDRIRGRLRLTENWLRLGPLTVGEIVKAVCDAAKTGSPAQTWDKADVRPLMQEVRVPGQPEETDDAEVQAAYAQIVCRTLFKEGALDTSAGAASGHGTIAAEPILQRYFDETLDGLDRGKWGLKDAALRLLEEHFVHPGDGSRRPLTETQALALAPKLKVGSEDVRTILKALNDAVILRAYDHQGIRYYELGHDWLAKRVFEQGKVRRHRKDLARVWTIASAAVVVAVIVGGLAIWGWVLRKEALTQTYRAEKAQADTERARLDASAQEKEKAKAIELARDATAVGGAREYMARKEPEVALGLLSVVQHPEERRGWVDLAVEVLSQAPFSIKLDGHTAVVMNAVFSPDGQHVVTASADKTARVWKADGSDKDHPVALQGHTDEVLAAAYSPDGQHIVTASWDKTARVWKADGSDKDHPLVLEGHAGPVYSAAYSPDGQHIVTASKDKTARVWKVDGSDKDHPLVLQGHANTVGSAAYSPDGQYIVTASWDKTARVWKVDGSDKDHPLILQGHASIVSSAAYSLDGQHIVTASADKTARVWKADGSDKNHPLVLQGHTHYVSSAAYSRDGQHIVTASWDKTARVWKADGSDKDHPLVLQGHTNWVLSAAYSRDGQHIVTASADKAARVWKVDDFDKGPVVLSGHTKGLTFAAYNWVQVPPCMLDHTRNIGVRRT